MVTIKTSFCQDVSNKQTRPVQRYIHTYLGARTRLVPSTVLELTGDGSHREREAYCAHRTGDLG